MTTNIIPLPVAARPAGHAGIAMMVVRRVVAAARMLMRRRELQTLTGFDDRMLADIGLTRGDLRDAVAEPLWRDPTAILVTRVHERRRARHAFGLPCEQRERTLAAPPLVPQHDRSDELFPARSRYY